MPETQSQGWSEKKRWILGIVAPLIVAVIVGAFGYINGYFLKGEKSCRDISHGFEKYQYTDNVSKSSGWVRGGKDPNWWCQTMKNEYQSTKPTKSLVWTGTKSSEQSRKSALGRVSYKYHCSATSSWDPIYKLKISDVCTK